jgi:hypothetical protein
MAAKIKDYQKNDLKSHDRRSMILNMSVSDSNGHCGLSSFINRGRQTWQFHASV